MNRILRIGSIALSSAATALALAAPAAGAATTRITEGDALAVFQAETTGGFAGQFHGNHVGEGIPAPLADETAPVVISPISSGPDDPYCFLDWHVIRVLVADDSRADLAADQVQIWLDGAQLALETTAIKPFASLGVPFYWRAYGAIVEPGGLAVGQHAVGTAITFADVQTLNKATTVTINTADRLACNGS